MSDREVVMKGTFFRLNFYRAVPAQRPGSTTAQSSRNKGGNIMRTLVTIAGLIAALTAGTALGQGESTASTSVRELGSYACPRHPEFQATWPARCPVCRTVLSRTDMITPTLVADEDNERRDEENQGREETREREERRERNYYRYNYPYGYYYPHRGYYYNPRTGYYYYPSRRYYYNPRTGYYYYPSRRYYYNPRTGYYYYPSRGYFYNPYTGRHYYPHRGFPEYDRQ
jgi:hypothetical protein